MRDLVAAFVGFEMPKGDGAPDASPPKYMTADDMKRLMAMTGGRVAGMG